MSLHSDYCSITAINSNSAEGNNCGGYRVGGYRVTNVGRVTLVDLYNSTTYAKKKTFLLLYLVSVLTTYTLPPSSLLTHR